MSQAVELSGGSSENMEERVIREVRRAIGDAVPGPVVVATVHRVLEPYRVARIQQFVPILATRDALTVLRAHGQS